MVNISYAFRHVNHDFSRIVRITKFSINISKQIMLLKTLIIHYFIFVHSLSLSHQSFSSQSPSFRVKLLKSINVQCFITELIFLRHILIIKSIFCHVFEELNLMVKLINLLLRNLCFFV